jgi:hypothetical protein
MKRMHLVILCILIFGTIVDGNAKAAEIKITKPLDGDTVERFLSIEGTSKNFTDFQKMWAVVYIPSINRYFPMDKRTLGFNLLADGKWATQAIIGNPNESGKKFQLLAVIADEKANNEITLYLDECNRKIIWPGIQKLPDGLMITDRISVVRE